MTTWQHILDLITDNMPELSENLPCGHPGGCGKTRVSGWCYPGMPEKECGWCADIARLKTIDDALELAMKENTMLRRALERIIRNDMTKFQHHQKRRDGKTPRQVDGGDIFLTPREIAQATLNKGVKDE